MGNKTITISSDGIIKEGFLFKQSRYLKKWRNRWVVLKPDYLYTFKQKGVYSNPTEQIEKETITLIKADNNESDVIFVRYIFYLIDHQNLYNLFS